MSPPYWTRGVAGHSDDSCSNEGGPVDIYLPVPKRSFVVMPAPSSLIKEETETKVLKYMCQLAPSLDSSSQLLPDEVSGYTCLCLRLCNPLYLITGSFESSFQSMDLMNCN